MCPVSPNLTRGQRADLRRPDSMRQTSRLVSHRIWSASIESRTCLMESGSREGFPAAVPIAIGLLSGQSGVGIRSCAMRDLLAHVDVVEDAPDGIRFWG